MTKDTKSSLADTFEREFSVFQEAGFKGTKWLSFRTLADAISSNKPDKPEKAKKIVNPVSKKEKRMIKNSASHKFKENGKTLKFGFIGEAFGLKEPHEVSYKRYHREYPADRVEEQLQLGNDMRFFEKQTSGDIIEITSNRPDDLPDKVRNVLVYTGFTYNEIDKKWRVKYAWKRLKLARELKKDPELEGYRHVKTESLLNAFLS